MPAAADPVQTTTSTNTLDTIPESYEKIMREKIAVKKGDSTYRTFRVLSRDADNKPFTATPSTIINRFNKKDNSTGTVTEEDGAISVWCSNDYLGMSSHPDVTRTVVETINKHGVGAGGTRSISGTSHYHVELENRLADLHNKERSLVFTSCYVANDTTLQTLARQLDAEIFSDSGNHASMIAGITNSRMPKHIFRHNDAEHLEELLAKSKLHSGTGQKSKQPIRTRYLGHVTGYQPIKDSYFLVRSALKLLWYTVGPRLTGPRFTGTPIYREDKLPPK
eukprot:sb/3467949/